MSAKFYRNLLACALVVLAWFNATPAGAVSSLDGKVIINEWCQSSGDWLELLVIQTADLRGMWICDEGGPDAANGLQLSTTDAFWSAVPAGTLIVFHSNNAAFSEDHNPADYKLVFNASTLADPTLFDSVNKNFKAYGAGTPTDNPRLFDKDLVLIQDWDQNNDAAFTGTLRASTAGDADVYTGNSAAGVSNPANWTRVSSGTTPGDPNGGANTTWIQSLRVAPAPDPSIAISPATLDFGSIAASAASTASLTIGNHGATQSLAVNSATVTGADAAKFTVLTALPLNVAHGTTSSLTIRFNPGGATGTFTAQLNLSSNDAQTSITTATLTGSSTASGGSALAGKVIINEWQQSSSGDWIELLVTQSADLRGMWVCDSGGPDAANGLEFSATNSLWASVPAGTLITIYDSGQTVTQDVDNSNFNLAFVAGTPEAAPYWDATNNHFKAFSSTTATDNPRIFDKDKVLIQDWDQNNDAAFIGTLRASAPLDTDIYIGSDAAGVSNPANWVMINSGTTPGSDTPGQPNGGVNSTWIATLRNLSTPNAARVWQIYQ